MARARGTPAGSVSSSPTLIGPALNSVTAASRLCSSSAGGHVVAGLSDGHLGPCEQFLAERRGEQDAGLVLQYAGIESGEDGPHPVLVEPFHHRLGALRVA